MSTRFPQPAHTNDPKSVLPGVMDVSDLPTARVRACARNAGNVYFERKGGRTFLVAERE